MAQTCILRAFGLQMRFCLSLALRFVYVSFSSFLLSLIPRPFVQSFNRSSICMCLGSNTQLANSCLCPPVWFLFCLLGDVAFSQCNDVPSLFAFCMMESEYVVVRFPSGLCFGLDF